MGPHATVYPEDILKENAWIDYILLGEYEETLLELCQSLKEGSVTKALPGMVMREGETILHGGSRELMENIDSLPWPAREFLPMHHYRDDFAGMPLPNLQMWASRGCPYTCIFCLWPAVMYGNQKYRTRTPVDVVDELEHCIEHYQIKSVFFDDDTFNIGSKRLIQLSQELNQRQLHIPWAIMARADLAEAKSLEAMQGAGLMAAKYGIESGNQAIVDRASKHLDLKKAEEGIKLTKSMGIKVHRSEERRVGKECRSRWSPYH